MIFRKGELFCGPGGLAFGAKSASVFNINNEEFKIEHAWANDLDPWACETFIKNICPDKPESVFCKDIKELDIKELKPIDAFSFGFPCNDYSVVGEQKGMDGDYGPLYTYGVKVLNVHNPKFFLAENVGGLESANEGKAFINILKDLSMSGEYGYDLTPHLYKFEEYGVPQKRHRIIIVGIRKDLGLDFKVPLPTHVDSYTTVSQALETPPIPQGAYNNELTKHNKKVIERLLTIPPGKNVWYEGVPDHLKLNVEKVRMSQIYKRLHPDEPSYTITGSGGGGTHGYHYSEYRALTNRERARIQTFPDHFEFCGPKEMVRKQIGMAVPPDGAKIIFKAVLNTFAGIIYPSIKSKWDFEKMQAKELYEEMKRIQEQDDLADLEALLESNKEVQSVT